MRFIKNVMKGLVVIAYLPVTIIQAIDEIIKVNNGYHKCYYNNYKNYFLLRDYE